MCALSLCFCAEEQNNMNLKGWYHGILIVFFMVTYADYEPVNCVQGEGTLHVVQPHCSAQQEDRDAGPDPYW
jgi:hypothetical protein